MGRIESAAFMLRRSWEELTAIAEVSREETFRESGGTSLFAVVFAERIALRLGVQVSPSFILASSLSELEARVVESMLTRKMVP